MNKPVFLNTNLTDISDAKCRCCGTLPNEVVRNVMKLKRKLIELQSKLPYFPLQILSFYRCQKNNEKVGGVPNSAHMQGLAVDIAADTSRLKYLIVKHSLELGINRIGLYPWGVHLDIDESKVSEVIWLHTDKT